MSPKANNSTERRALRRRLLLNRALSYLGLLLSMAGMGFIIVLLITLLGTGHRAFHQAFIEVDFSEEVIEAITAPGASPEESFTLIRQEIAGFLSSALRLEGAGASERKEAIELVSSHAPFFAYERILDEPRRYLDESMLIPASSAVDQYLKSPPAQSGDSNVLSPAQARHVATLAGNDILSERFSLIFLTHSDSRLPEMSGIFGAVMGSALTLLVTFIIAIPLGIASAVYLQEFAPPSRLLRLLEVNINNLAAVPSIIFGLFGLGIFINLFGMPRSVPLVGGIVLALMTFPTIVIASRQALLAVPTSLREGALAVGATRHQMVFHHVVPQAMPSMMTGSIIGMAQALGETAPLLMLGMVAFIASAPTGILDAATTLPVQIYLWSDSPERGIAEKTFGAILALILFLVLMNALAVYLRFRFERSRRL